jgi:hypothetical protein
MSYVCLLTTLLIETMVMHNETGKSSAWAVLRDTLSFGKHNRSLKVAVQGLDFMAHPLYIHTLSFMWAGDNKTMSLGRVGAAVTL